MNASIRHAVDCTRGLSLSRDGVRAFSGQGLYSVSSSNTPDCAPTGKAMIELEVRSERTCFQTKPKQKDNQQHKIKGDVYLKVTLSKSSGTQSLGRYVTRE